jgi:hypothetical protein
MDQFTLAEVKEFFVDCTNLYCNEGPGVICNFLEEVAEMCKVKFGIIIVEEFCGKQQYDNKWILMNHTEL